MDLSPQLRPARLDDAEFLWALHRQTLRAAVEQTWGPWDDAAQRQYFDLGFAPAHTSIILLAGCPVGRLDVQRSPADIFLGLIEILPELQGRGLGSRLVQGLQAEARTARLPIRLQVLKANAAAGRLYQRLGFATTGQTTTHHLMQWAP